MMDSVDGLESHTWTLLNRILPACPPGLTLEIMDYVDKECVGVKWIKINGALLGTKHPAANKYKLKCT